MSVEVAANAIGTEYKLDGHAGAVTLCRFDLSYERLATGGVDRLINLWQVPKPDEVDVNYGVLRGHRGAVTSVVWKDDQLVSSSSDGTVGYWDLHHGTRLRKWTHGETVNDVTVTESSTVVSVGDNGDLKLWDLHQSQEVATVTGEYPLITVTSFDNHVYTAGVEGIVRVYDVRSIDTPVWECTDISSLAITSLRAINNMMVARQMDGIVHTINTREIVADGACRVYDTCYTGTTPTSQWGCRASFSPATTEVVSGGQGGTVFDTGLGRALRLFNENDIVIDVDVGSGLLASATNHGAFIQPLFNLSEFYAS